MERSVLTIFLYPGGSFLKHELLGARYADVAGRIGASLEDKLEAEVLARLFGDVALAAQNLHAHVAGERGINERLGAHLLGHPDHKVALAHIVGSDLSLIHISEPTRLGMISYAVFCLRKQKKE